MASLKLNGMRDAYQAICELPASQQPDQHQLIATILDAESQSRSHQKTSLFLRLSKLKYAANINNLLFDPQRNLEKNIIASLADGSYIHRGHNVLISGATGCGKSYLTSALGHQACLLGYRTLYYNMNRLNEQIAISKLDGSFLKWINNIQKVKLLIIHDFGIQPLSQQVKLALLQILEDRYNSAATIFASQLPFDKWFDFLDDPTIADAILDRINHNATKINLKGKSLRAAI